jgi:transposase
MAGMNEKGPEVSTCGSVDTKQACVAGRRRHWPVALKRQIVAETLVPGASASVVARRHDVNTNQLFRWRRDWRDGLLDTADGDPGLVPVSIAGREASAAAGSGVIEIELAHGARVRVSGRVDAAALGQVLEILSRR